jgi:hypothetical protein
MAKMIGDPEPSMHNVGTGICRLSAERGVSWPPIGMAPAEDEVVVVRVAPGSFLHGGHEF